MHISPLQIIHYDMQAKNMNAMMTVHLDEDPGYQKNENWSICVKLDWINFYLNTQNRQNKCFFYI